MISKQEYKSLSRRPFSRLSPPSLKHLSVISLLEHHKNSGHGVSLRFIIPSNLVEHTDMRLLEALVDKVAISETFVYRSNLTFTQLVKFVLADIRTMGDYPIPYHITPYSRVLTLKQFKALVIAILQKHFAQSCSLYHDVDSYDLYYYFDRLLQDFQNLLERDVE